MVFAAIPTCADGASWRVGAHPSGWGLDVASGAEADAVAPGGTAWRALCRLVVRPARAEPVRAEVTTGFHPEIQTEKSLA
ncbi:hypothetical protein [Parafrankia sp. FMc2]|uniref:hypothetical protein n=1 Tax=Parafrankia sp. FMc2 TaxID=3233196 RepID=UPI0034D690C8